SAACRGISMVPAASASGACCGAGSLVQASRRPGRSTAGSNRIMRRLVVGGDRRKPNAARLDMRAARRKAAGRHHPRAGQSAEAAATRRTGQAGTYHCRMWIGLLRRGTFLAGVMATMIASAAAGASTGFSEAEASAVPVTPVGNFRYAYLPPRSPSLEPVYGRVAELEDRKSVV